MMKLDFSIWFLNQTLYLDYFNENLSPLFNEMYVLIEILKAIYLLIHTKTDEFHTICFILREFVNG